VNETRTAALALALGLASAGVGLAAEELVVTLDPAASHVRFVLDATAHKVEGEFRLVAGEVRLDPGTGAARGEVTVDAKSGKTGNEKRDRKMHAAVLESEAFPIFALEVERIEGRMPADGAKGDVKIHGALAIHGAKHPLSIPAQVQFTGGNVALEATFSIPYVEWGMKDPSAFVLRVAKTVQVHVSARGTRAR
jgi:polyisoprenoid-binding protein YceI